MAMTPAQEAQYALDWDLDPASLKADVRAEYDRLKPERDQRRAERAFRPQQAPSQRHPIENEIRGFLAMHWLKLGGAAGVLIIGIIMQAATGSKVVLCNSFAGQLGQAFSSQANSDCTVVSGIHSLGVVLTWLGVLGLAAAGGFLWMGYDKASKARAKLARQAQSATAPAAPAEPPDIHRDPAPGHRLSLAPGPAQLDKDRIP